MITERTIQCFYPTVNLNQILEHQSMKQYPIEKEEDFTEIKAEESATLYSIDDSSDEEEIEQKTKSYDIETSLNRYKSNHRFPYEDESFITHSLGIETLYSTSVNQSYYSKKRLLLGNNILPKEEKIVLWIENTVTDLLEKTFILSSQKPVTQHLLEEFLKQYEPIIQITKQTLLKEQRSLFRQEHIQNIAFPLENALTSLKETLIHFIKNIPEQSELITDVNTLTAKKLAGDTSMFGLIYDSNRITEWLDKEGLLDPSDPKRPLTSNQKSNPNLGQKVEEIKQRNLSFGEATLIKIFSESRARDVEKRISEKGIILAEAYAVDIIHAELKRGENSLLREVKKLSTGNPVFTEYLLTKALLPDEIPEASPLKNLAKVSPNFFAKFLPYTTELLKAELLQHMDVFLKNFVASLSKQRKQLSIIFERAVLPEQHPFSSKNAIDFLANLRLSNRSQKRNIRQQKEDGITEFDGEIVSRSWKFAGSSFLALETQEITTTGARSDLVNNLGSYNDIYKAISDIKSLINLEIAQKGSSINNADIARWIRQLLNGETTGLFTYQDKTPLPVESKYLKKLSKFCVNLTFLLFGTESVRNPASLITQQMMLDLILSGDLTWKQALADDAKMQNFGGGDMPMSMGSHKVKVVKKGKEKETIIKAEPVASARSLHKEYANTMLYPYQYPGETQNSLDKIKALSQREASITQKWIEKFAKDASTTPQKIEALKHKRKTEWYKIL